MGEAQIIKVHKNPSTSEGHAEEAYTLAGSSLRKMKMVNIVLNPDIQEEEWPKCLFRLSHVIQYESSSCLHNK